MFTISQIGGILDQAHGFHRKIGDAAEREVGQKHTKSNWNHQQRFILFDDTKIQKHK